MTWFSRVPLAGRGFREVLGEEAQRRARLLALAGPVGVVAAMAVAAVMEAMGGIDAARGASAAVAVFFATVGVLAGVIGGSALHALAGLYSGMAAGGFFFAVVSAAEALMELDPQSGLLVLVATLMCLAGAVGAFPVFGALFCWADRRPGRMKRGAKAALIWAFLLFMNWMVAWAASVVFALVALILVGFLVPAAAAVLTGLVFVALSIYAVYHATRGFFLEMRGIYDPMVEGLKAVRQKRRRTGPAGADGVPRRARAQLRDEGAAVKVRLPYGRGELAVSVPDSAELYEASYPGPAGPADELVLGAVRSPVGSAPLTDALSARSEGDVVLVVSDITRPIPYAQFLPGLLAEIESAGVRAEEILILVATGMHRPSTEAERVEMFGPLARRYRVTDHRAEVDSELEELPSPSGAGARVRLSRHYLRAGFRIITGLVEPHFMAGFSGGRKAVCPGLASLETIRRFHGAEFLADPRATNANLIGNPLHEEALSVARLAGVEFSVNVVLDRRRRVVRAFAGELDAAHAAACRFSAEHACPVARGAADVVLTSCGGYPLDATFYQCVKAVVGALPVVRPGGKLIVAGGCSEGIGSPEYAGLMRRYSGRWREFLADIAAGDEFVKDQWEFQMHARALEKVGEEGILFATDGLAGEELARLSVAPVAHSPGEIAGAVQAALDDALTGGATLAVIPEGPYCTPVGTAG